MAIHMIILRGYTVDQLWSRSVMASHLCMPVWLSVPTQSTFHAYITTYLVILFLHVVYNPCRYGYMLTYSLLCLPIQYVICIYYSSLASSQCMHASLIYSYSYSIMPIPSLQYNSLCDAQSVLPIQPAYAAYSACLCYCLLSLPIIVYLLQSTWLSTMLCLNSLVSFL